MGDQERLDKNVGNQLGGRVFIDRMAFDKLKQFKEFKFDAYKQFVANSYSGGYDAGINTFVRPTSTYTNQVIANFPAEEIKEVKEKKVRLPKAWQIKNWPK